MDVRNLPVATGAVSGQLVSGSGRVLWHSFKETTGNAGASYTLRDGSNTSGATMLPVTLSSNESTRDWMGDKGIPFRTGLYLEVVSGSIEGNVVVELCDLDTVEPIPVVVSIPVADVLPPGVLG